MKIVKPHIVSLMVGALVGALMAAGQAVAAPTEAQFKETEDKARAAAIKWRDEIKESFKSLRKHEEYLKAMQESSETLSRFLVDKPCRDGAQAKVIEKSIHDAFHTLYGRVVADIDHAVDLNCRFNKLTVTFRLRDFKPTAQAIAGEKRSGDAAKERQEMETKTKRILGIWATRLGPNLTDKSKTLQQVRVAAVLITQDAAIQMKEIPCLDETNMVAATHANMEAAKKELAKFTDYSFELYCTGKKLDLRSQFGTLKPK